LDLFAAVHANIEKTPKTVAASIPKNWRRKYSNSWDLIGVLLSDRIRLMDRSSFKIGVSFATKRSSFVVVLGMKGVEVFVEIDTLVLGLIETGEVVVLADAIEVSIAMTAK